MFVKRREQQGRLAEWRARADEVRSALDHLSGEHEVLSRGVVFIDGTRYEHSHLFAITDHALYAVRQCGPPGQAIDVLSISLADAAGVSVRVFGDEPQCVLDHAGRTIILTFFPLRMFGSSAPTLDRVSFHYEFAERLRRLGVPVAD